MPTSKSRTKRHPSLKGIPAQVLKCAPADWSPARQASWCQSYMRGLVGIDLTRSQRLGDYHLRLAHQKGQRDSGNQVLVESARAFISSHDREVERDYYTPLSVRLSGLYGPRPFHQMQPEPWRR